MTTQYQIFGVSRNLGLSMFAPDDWQKALVPIADPFDTDEDAKSYIENSGEKEVLDKDLTILPIYRSNSYDLK